MTFTAYKRKVLDAEDRLVRAVMPRTAAADPVEPPVEVSRTPRRVWRNGSLVVKDGFTLAEVAHA